MQSTFWYKREIDLDIPDWIDTCLTMVTTEEVEHVCLQREWKMRPVTVLKMLERRFNYGDRTLEEAVLKTCFNKVTPEVKAI